MVHMNEEGKLIYAADDDRNIRSLLAAYLKDAGYRVTVFETGDDLMEAFQRVPCDLAVLDIMMPGTDGLELCRQLRAISAVPIIMLTAKESEMDYSVGIHSGSDDYLTKPFRPSMLVMRIKALFRRIEMEHAGENKEQQEKQIRCFDLNYLPDQRRIYAGTRELPLTVTELAVLRYFMERPNLPVGRDELLSRIWGYQSDVETRVTDDTIRRIRRKLSACNSHSCIRTEWGYGYKLSCETAEKRSDSAAKGEAQ